MEKAAATVPVKMFIRAAASGGRDGPLYVVFFVTERCTAKCAHCLLGQWTPQANELSLDEIERWARAMPEFYFLLATGGEPFLRDDLPDIVRLFVRHCGVRNVGIPTNGSLTELSVASCARILAENPRTEFAVDVSFDEIGDAHDANRGMTGLFAKAEATFRELQSLARANPRFNLNVALTVSAFNQERLPEILDYLVRGLGAGNINHLLVRGAPRDPASLDVKPENYAKLNKLLEEYLLNGKLGGYSGYGVADGINAMKLVRQKLIERTLRTGRRKVVCRAGELGAVVRAGGEVFPCELLDSPMGNLRDSDFDFLKLWRSQQAEQVRRGIAKTKCFCTYECFLTLNILFDPAHALKVGARWAALKTRRREA